MRIRSQGMHRLGEGQPFRALMECLQIEPEDLEDLPRSEGEPYEPHAEFEERHPEYREYAEMIEVARREQHIVVNDSDEGYEPEREFPCPGMLRIEDPAADVLAAICDRCGIEIGMPVAKMAPERLVAYRTKHAELAEPFVGKRFDPDPRNEQTLKTCRQWVKEFRPGADAIPAPAIHGKVGIGKTHLLTLIAQTVIENHKTDTLYVSTLTLMASLREGLDSGEYERRWRRVANVALLLLDDLGAERLTEWTRERLAALVDWRYQHELPIVAATNIPPSGWDRAFGDRTASRLRGMTLALQLLGEDRRQASLLGAES